MFFLLPRILLIGIILVLTLFLLEKAFNQFFHVKKKKLAETAGKRIDRIGRLILTILCLAALPLFFIHEATFTQIKWYLIFFVTIFAGFQLFMEWKYIKGSKQYLTTLLLFIIGVSLLYYMDTFIYDLLF